MELWNCLKDSREKNWNILFNKFNIKNRKIHLLFLFNKPNKLFFFFGYPIQKLYQYQSRRNNWFLDFASIHFSLKNVNKCEFEMKKKTSKERWTKIYYLEHFSWDRRFESLTGFFFPFWHILNWKNLKNMQDKLTLNNN